MNESEALELEKKLNVDEEEEPVFTQNLMMETLKKIRGGVTRKQIITFLANKGFKEANANNLIYELAKTTNNHCRLLMRSGIFWGIVGVILTIFLYVKSSVNPPLIAYIMFWSIGVIGFYDFIRGLRGFYKTRQYSK